MGTVRSSVIAAILVVVAVFCATVVIAFPRQDQPQRVDVIVILGGPISDSIGYGIQLAESGVSANVLVSTPPGTGGEFGKAACAARHRVNVVCFTPRNATTEGEAQSATWRADKEGWHSMLVVTAKFHVARARFIFDRCNPGTVLVRATAADIGFMEWLYQLAYQSGAFVKAAISSKC